MDHPLHRLGLCFLAAVFLACSLLGVDWQPGADRGLSLAATAQAGQPAIAKKEEKPPMLIFKNESYDFEFRRAIAYTISGGADINECLYTGMKIVEGDDESWYTHWRALADRIQAIGEGCLAAGYRVSAREAFLRASMYYRSAEFYLHGNPKDPRILDTWGRSRKSFRQAAKLMDHPVEVVRIPYEGTTLPGYILRPDESMAPRKTLIIQTGFDGTGEELYFSNAFFALKRGYNVLIFEGPGQGGALREQHLYFRKDWEKVVTPVIDFALTRPELDPKRLALMGISMGGYLAPRAAAYDHRLAALIANEGVYDMLEDMGNGHKEKVVEEMKKYPQESNEDIRKKMKSDPGFRWVMDNGMFTFGVKTPVEFILAEAEYTLKGIAPLIKCPTLIISSEDEQFFPGQAKQVFAVLTCPKTLMTFTRKDMASWHCQIGACAISNQRILDWLDETLAQVR